MQHRIGEAAAGAPAIAGVDGDEGIAVRRNGARIIYLRQEPLRDELWSGESQRAGVADGAVVPKTCPPVTSTFGAPHRMLWVGVGGDNRSIELFFHA